MTDTKNGNASISVGARTKRAATLQLAVRVVLVITALGQQLIVARIVEPSVYGLIGLTMLTLGFLFVFSETGVAGSIILADSVGEQELNFAFTLQAARGIILSLALLIAAPFAATFFREPELTNLIRFMAIQPLVTGLESPRLLLLKRNLAYERLSILQVSYAAVMLALTIPLAIRWENAWAILVASLIATIMQAILSYVLAPHRSRLYWSSALANRFSRFGRWAFINKILHYFIRQTDSFVIGRILDASALGLYTMAYRLGNMPFSELGTVIDDIAFPAFRQSGKNIKNAFTKMLGIAFVATTPLAIGLGIIAPHLIPFLVGDKWLGAVAPLQVLCAWAVIRAMLLVTGPLFNSQGRPEIQTVAAALTLLGIAVTIIPFTHRWGITGAATALLTGFAISVPVIYTLAYRLIQFSITSVLKMIAIPLMGGGIMIAIVQLLFGVLDPNSNLQHLIIAIPSGAVAYVSWIMICTLALGYTAAEPIITLVRSSAHRVMNSVRPGK